MSFLKSSAFLRVGTFALITICATGLSGQTEASQHLKSSDEQDLRRLNGVTLERYNALESHATPLGIQSNQLLVMLNGAQPKAADYLFLWHGVSLDATSTDHLPLLTGSTLTYHEEFGPPRTSRALALMHLAMFEAVNGLTGEPYTSYLGVHADVDKNLDAEAVQGAAIVEAAYETLSWVYPGLNQSALIGEQNFNSMPAKCTPEDVQEFSLSFYYQCSLVRLNNNAHTDSPSVSAGRAFGRAVFVALLAARANDGSEAQDPTFGIDFLPARVPVGGVYPLLQWQPDPVSKLQLALGGNWGKVKPFALSWGGELRIPEEQSAIARFHLATTKKTDWPSYGLLLNYGVEPRMQKDGVAKGNPLVDIAKFWAYDGTAGLCAPVRLYNELADEYLAQVAMPLMKTVVDEARYYALLNLAMADAAVAAWDSKFHFQLARPVTVIRSTQMIEDIGPKAATPKAVFEKSEALAPDSLPPGAPGEPVQGVPENIGEKFANLWYPLGAQNSNAATPYNITPPFPAYPSGHAVFGGAVFGILRQYAPKSNPSQQFTFQSDEYNGNNADAYNFLRCSKDDPQTGSNFCNNIQPHPGRMFTLDCAERENADSRVFMGVHWSFDADDGVEMGNEVALHAWNMLLQPKGPGDKRQFSQFVETTSKRSADKIRSYAPYTDKERKSLVCPNVTYPDAVLKGFDMAQAMK